MPGASTGRGTGQFGPCAAAESSKLALLRSFPPTIFPAEHDFLADPLLALDLRQQELFPAFGAMYVAGVELRRQQAWERVAHVVHRIELDAYRAEAVTRGVE